VVCPYKINVGEYYPVEFSLNMEDGIEPEVLEKEAYGFEKNDRNYGYVLRGKLSKNKLDLGPFSIEDDYLKQLSNLFRKISLYFFFKNWFNYYNRRYSSNVFI
jgi:hypothetical protein